MGSATTFGFAITDVRCSTGVACTACAVGKYKTTSEQGTISAAGVRSGLTTIEGEKNQCICCAAGQYNDQTAQIAAVATYPAVTCPAGEIRGWKRPPGSLCVEALFLQVQFCYDFCMQT